MTGYGKAELNLENANFTIEVKSLNSKQIDATVKMSSVYRDKEIGLRKLLSGKLQRGKIELSIWREKSESPLNYSLNTAVIKQYHQQILQLKKNNNSLVANCKKVLTFNGVQHLTYDSINVSKFKCINSLEVTYEYLKQNKIIRRESNTKKPPGAIVCCQLNSL